MKLFHRNIISKLTVALLTISVFCSFVLSGGDLFALETGVQKDVDSKASSRQSDGNRNALISNNRIVFDFLISKPFEENDFDAEPRYSIKTFLLLTFIKYASQKSLSIYSRRDRHLRRIAQDPLPAYLLYNNLRI